MSDETTIETDDDGYTRLEGDVRASDMTLFDTQDRAIVRAAAEQFVGLIATLVARTPLADDDALDGMTEAEFAAAAGEVVLLTAGGLAHVVREVFADLTDTVRVGLPAGDDRREVVIELRATDDA